MGEPRGEASPPGALGAPLRGAGMSLGAPLRGAGISLGVPAIDARLPPGGLAWGAMHEVMGQPGDAAAFGFAAALLGGRGGGRPLLWCRPGGQRQEAGLPYGPGLARFGLSPDRLIVAEAGAGREVLWALEEGLRSAALAGVIGEVAACDLTASRRLQLAAERAGSIALLLRGAGNQGAAGSAAVSRWEIAAAGGGDRVAFDVALLKCRGGGTGRWRLEWDDAALRFHLVAVLADRPPAPRRADA
jgi:protein ImuA